jgi:hypothetical protein
VSKQEEMQDKLPVEDLGYHGNFEGDAPGQAEVEETINQNRHEVFDQRFQRIGVQYNFAGDLIIGSRQIPSRPPLQCPPRAEHFTGREEELCRLLADLQPGRVVTLCGPGGVGKTALSAQAIWTLTHGDEPPECFPDGIIFHSFYHQPQAALALEAIARAYGEEPKPTLRDAAHRALVLQP